MLIWLRRVLITILIWIPVVVFVAVFFHPTNHYVNLGLASLGYLIWLSSRPRPEPSDAERKKQEKYWKERPELLVKYRRMKIGMLWGVLFLFLMVGGAILATAGGVNNYAIFLSVLAIWPILFSLYWFQGRRKHIRKQPTE
jgi:hypothetical protein